MKFLIVNALLAVLFVCLPFIAELIDSHIVSLVLGMGWAILTMLHTEYGKY